MTWKIFMVFRGFHFFSVSIRHQSRRLKWYFELLRVAITGLKWDVLFLEIFLNFAWCQFDNHKLLIKAFNILADFSSYSAKLVLSLMSWYKESFPWYVYVIILCWFHGKQLNYHLSFLLEYCEFSTHTEIHLESFLTIWFSTIP